MMGSMMDSFPHLPVEILASIVSIFETEQDLIFLWTVLRNVSTLMRDLVDDLVRTRHLPHTMIFSTTGAFNFFVSLLLSVFESWMLEYVEPCLFGNNVSKLVIACFRVQPLCMLRSLLLFRSLEESMTQSTMLASLTLQLKDPSGNTQLSRPVWLPILTTSVVSTYTKSAPSSTSHTKTHPPQSSASPP